ncbi:MAG: amino acid ABC transporter permease [Hyphomicrobiaceae bacterium]|nr:amino acid ABC transporter permease [Hyphomicrobiaceae bacterium]
MREFGNAEVLFIVFALQWTLTLTALAFFGGGIAGIAVALLRISRSRYIRLAVSGYIQVVQGTPLLVLMFLCYYAPSLFGIELNALFAAGIALTLNASAFLGAIWESALRAIPKAQWESAEALALPQSKVLRFVIAPQAVRIALPSTVGYLVQIVKETSLASIIGFVEITRAGQLVSNATFEPMKAYVCVALLYFLICFPLSRFSQWLETRSPGRTKGPSRG